jgi:hypothetical protein
VGLFDFLTVLSSKGASLGGGGECVDNQPATEGEGHGGGVAVTVEVEVETVWPIDRCVGL